MRKKWALLFLVYGFMMFFVEPVYALIYGEASAYHSIADVSVQLPNGALVSGGNSGWTNSYVNWVPAAGLGVEDLNLLTNGSAGVNISGTVGAANSKSVGQQVWFSIKGGESGVITFTMPYTLHAKLLYPSLAENFAYTYALSSIGLRYYSWSEPWGATSKDVDLLEWDILGFTSGGGKVESWDPDHYPSAGNDYTGVLSLSMPYDATLGYVISGYFSDSVALAIPEPIPEPSTMLLFGAGLGCIAMWGKRRKPTF